MLTSRQVSYLALITTGLVLILVIQQRKAKPPDLLGNPAKIVAWEEATIKKPDWGEMRVHFAEQTFGTDKVLVGMGVVEPGKAVHPGHRHDTEEYLVITKGAGAWTIDGKEIPAKVNDVLYAGPWAMHGLINKSSEPMTFVVFRYAGKGVKPAPRPDDGKPDEVAPMN